MNRLLTAVFLFSFVLVTAFPVSLSAQEEPDAYTTACDPAYMRTLNKKAAMEAQRDMTTNVTFIKKADSVFVYTCFMNMLDHAARFIGPIYSESFYTPSTPPNTAEGKGNRLNLADDLRAGAYFPVRNYLFSSFNHSIFGGIPDSENGLFILDITSLTAGSSQHLVLDDNGRPKYAFDNWATSDRPYQNCAVMARVYEMARCMDAKETDFFYYTKMKDAAGEDVPIGGRALKEMTDTNIRYNAAFANGTTRPPERGKDYPMERFGSGTEAPSDDAYKHSFSCSNESTLQWDQNFLNVAFNEVPQAAPKADEDVPDLYKFRSYLNSDQEPDKYPDDEAQFNEPWFEFFEKESECGQPIPTGAVYFDSSRGGCLVDGFCAVPGCKFSPIAQGSEASQCQTLQQDEVFWSEEIGTCQ